MLTLKTIWNKALIKIWYAIMWFLIKSYIALWLYDILFS